MSALTPPRPRRRAGRRCLAARPPTGLRAARSVVGGGYGSGIRVQAGSGHRCQHRGRWRPGARRAAGRSTAAGARWSRQRPGTSQGRIVPAPDWRWRRARSAPWAERAHRSMGRRRRRVAIRPAGPDTATCRAGARRPHVTRAHRRRRGTSPRRGSSRFPAGVERSARASVAPSATKYASAVHANVACVGVRSGDAVPELGAGEGLSPITERAGDLAVGRRPALAWLANATSLALPGGHRPPSALRAALEHAGGRYGSSSSACTSRYVTRECR
ncbi:hypothetical protein J2S41_002783 [Catenuloplanes atrovinosus]|uniref:Uncharacterized protein n=1 Tax=Catenuloplanes atrovinosus TaxID=137266 RepID=A0AAE3YM14_9ACTN|nr:hypothetical protein [Catenuloplanes atrovinosus]